MLFIVCGHEGGSTTHGKRGFAESIDQVSSQIECGLLKHFALKFC